jgi:hypothetical protein
MTSKAHAEVRQTQDVASKRPQALEQLALAHATRLIHRVCCLAGKTDLIDEIRSDNRPVRSAIERHDTGALFDWLMGMVSYQGISDQVASGYMELHGRTKWCEIERALANKPSCPKLESYWHFCDCKYHKGTSKNCSH